MYFAVFFIGLSLLTESLSHMIMCYPPPRGYVGNRSYSQIDYDLSAPLASLVFCKGKSPGTPVLTVSPGDTIPVQFYGSARHNGGKCQFSLSYDNDKTFYAIGEYNESCPNAEYVWPVRLPETLPPCERCTFAWTWINAVGNREFYMNCADIRVLKGRKSLETFSGPPIDIANVSGSHIEQPQGSDSPPGQFIVPL